MRTTRSLLARAGLTAWLLAVPALGHASKIDTHLWVGLQVVNDLEDDGMITVKLNGRPVALPVPVEVSNAILAHRNEYLLGHLGPDALPDVVVGQTLVHPGSAAGWKANDWMTFLLASSEGNPLGTALAYGVLGHAATDLFAHTSVNQYAGDIFDLADETLVEQRHVALESFVSRFNPPFLNAAGQDLGAPWTFVAPSDAMAAFVRDVLIYDDQAAGQYANGDYSKHLWAYRGYRNAIQKAADNPLWRDIDTAVAQIAAAYFDIQLSSEEAGRLVDFLNDEVIPRVQRRTDLTQEQLSRLNAAINRFDAERFSELNDALRRTMSINSTIASKLAERLEAEGKLCRTINERVCRFIACCPVPRVFGRCPVPENPFCDEVCEWATRLQCDFGEDAGRAAADLIRRIDEELNGSGGLNDQLLQSAMELRDQMVAARNNSLELAQALIDLQQVIGSNTSPVKALLTNWVGDLDVAMAAYVKAATSTMINTMNPTLPTSSVLRPMADWWDCYHLTIAGVPAPVGTGSCGFRGNLERTWGALESMADIVEDAASLAPSRVAGLPSPAEIRKEIERLKQDAIDRLKEAAIDALIDLLPQEVQDLILVLHEDMTEERLRYYFTKPETNASKGLLLIGDVDLRVKAEMQLTAFNRYDPERYPVVYNAVVLAKLALLDEAGLAVLAQEAGVSLASDGTALFAGTANVIADSLASMDGNHQWMGVAPPRPDGDGAPYRPAGPGPGYPNPEGYASARGFVPWKPEARGALFRSLFIGPLSPGIESPGEIGMPEVLQADYPYRPCRAYPFPDDENDRTCAALKVMPAVLQLLLGGSN